MENILKADTNDYVVLLHGISRDPRIMRKLEFYLNNLGYDVRNIGYPSTQFSCAELARQVWQKVKEACPDQNKKIHFVAHSLGSLLVRAILAEYEIPNLGRVVMIAPPNHGTEVANFFAKYQFYRKKFGIAGQELVTGPKGFAQQLPQKGDFDFGVIAGNRTVDFLLTWFILPSKGDGKVTIESTKLEGMKDHIVVGASHPHITKKAITAYQAAYFLKFDRFDHSK